MSQNPYDAPQFDSIGPDAGSKLASSGRSRKTRLEAHASAFGHGIMAYLAVSAWISVAIRWLSLTGRWTSQDFEVWILLGWLAPLLPGLLVWAIVLHDGLANRNSRAIRWLSWIMVVAMVTALITSGLLMDD
jgi:hypothetical protein